MTGKRVKPRTSGRGVVNREDLEELYEERAGILEHMGGWPKEKAEALAKAEVETIRRALAKEGKAE